MIEDQIIKGNDAQHLLDNPILKEAFDLLHESIDDRLTSITTTDVKECQDVIRTKQLLLGIEKAIYTFIETGKYKKAELAALTKEKNSIFSRGY